MEHALAQDRTGLANIGFSSVLDGIRWVAALSVVATHASGRILVPFSELQDASLFATTFYAMTSFGHTAVVVFFVLSGYLVGGKGIVAVARGSFNPRDYLAARTARLYAVLLPALVLTAAADGLSRAIANEGGFHAAKGYANLDLWTAYINVMMLQSFQGPTFGSNTPLWSLSYELWFYVLFCFIALAAKQRGWRAGASVLCAMGLVALLGVQFLWYFLLWSLGGLAATVPLRGSPNPILTGPLFVACLVAARLLGDASADVVQAFAIAGLLWSLKGSELVLMVRAGRMNSGLADFSYSLYATHYPVLLLLLTVAGGPALPGGYSMRLELDPGSVSLFLAAVACCVMVAWLFARVTERRTNKLRRWLCRERAWPPTRGTRAGSEDRPQPLG